MKNIPIDHGFNIANEKEPTKRITHHPRRPFRITLNLAMPRSWHYLHFLEHQLNLSRRI